MKTVSAIELDSVDRRILRLLQADGRMTNADLAREVALSESACLRRLKALEASGVIARYAAVIAERAVGLPISVFVTVTLASQAEAALTAFEQAVAAVPEVRDVDDLERLHAKALTRLPGVNRVSSSVAMRTVVKRAALPV